MAIVGYWRFDGNSNDASGNSNNGTDTDITYTNVVNNSQKTGGFNGSSSKIVVANSLLPSTPTSFTISAWVKLDIPNLAGQNIISDRYGTDNPGSYRYKYTFSLNYSAPNYLFFLYVYNYGIGGLTNLLYTGNLINTTKKVHLSGTITIGGTCYLFIDSKVVATKVYVANSYPSETNQSTIGAWTGGLSSNYNNFLDGNIDDLLIDNTPWSFAKIKNEYARVKGFFS